MARFFFVKVDTLDPASWKQVNNLFVKKTSTVWTAVNDAWVKATPTLWRRFWTSATNPDSPIEILNSLNTNEELRLQGVNYHWTPTPSSLAYRFLFVNESGTIVVLKNTTTIQNPISGTPETLPTSTTYQTISRTNFNHFTVGGESTYQFEVKGTSVSGTTVTQKAEFKLRTPAAPTVAVETVSATSVKLTVTAATSDDYFATGRYIVYTNDAVGGLIESGGGRGGYAANADPKIITLTGLTAGREYDIYVAPFTGTSGSTTATATGYPGVEAMETFATPAPYTFTFGKVLHVSTNGYVSIDSANSVDSIASTTGRVIGILPQDLQQDSVTSVWYWSDESEFRIRWEGYRFGAPADIRQYEIIFYKDQSYVQVFGINVTNATQGVQAVVKDGTVQTSYPTAVVTGARYVVSLDGSTAPAVQVGPYVAKSKLVMKQLTALSSGSLDIGYSSITTNINQNITPTLGNFNVTSFVKNFPSSSAQGIARTTTLEWEASTNATKYEVEYQGSTDNVNWVTVQSHAAASFVYGTSDTRTWSSPVQIGNLTYYTFIRAKVRANGDNGETQVISDSGSYVEAPGVAPGALTFGTITKTNNSASIPVNAPTSQGSNSLYTQIEYKTRTDSGTYPTGWSVQAISSGVATVALSSLSSSTKYWIKARVRNLDEVYSAEAETNFTTNAGATAPTSLTATSNSSNHVTLTWDGGSATYYEFAYPSSNTAVPSAAEFGTAGTITSSPYNFAAPRGFDYYYFVRSVVGTTTTNTKSGWYPATAPGVKGRRLLYPPPTPGTPTAGGITTTNITVSWTAGTNGTSNDTATSYEVYTSTSSTAPTSTTSGTEYTSPKSFTYTASTSPTKQYFWVRGVTEGGKSAWSSVLEATPTALNPPGVVSSIAGTPTSSTIAWTWSAPTSGGTPTGYEYALATATTPVPTTFTNLGSTTRSLTSSSLTASTDYYLFVKAKNADGISSAERNASAVKTSAAASYTATASSARGYNAFTLTYALTGDTKSVKVEYGTSTSYGTSAGTFTSNGSTSPGPLAANTLYYWRVTPYSNNNGTGTAGTAITGSVSTYITPAHTASTPATPTFQRFTSGTNSYIRYGWNNQSTLTPTGDYASWGYEFRVYSNVALTTQLAGSPFSTPFKASGFDLRLINNNQRIYVFSGEGSGTPYVGDFAYQTAAVYGRYRPYYIPHGSTTKTFGNWSAAL